MLPFFTIIVPSYNRAGLILKTINSVLEQTFKDFELIVVDDGSTDDTDNVVKVITDKRFFYYKKQNRERGATRNFGIKNATGKYITFIDSDDLMYANALQNAFENIEKLNNPSCFAQAFEVIDSRSGKQLQAPTFVQTETINNQILKGNFLGCIGVFVKNEVLQKINFEEDRLFAGTEDWLLWLMLAARYPFYYSNIVCASMIEHENRSVLGFSEDKLMYRSKRLKTLLSQDEAFLKVYGESALNKIYAHMLSYTALHLAMAHKKGSALKCFFKAVKVNIGELFTRRTMGIFKTILLK